jgi:hypothetical protein
MTTVTVTMATTTTTMTTLQSLESQGRHRRRLRLPSSIDYHASMAQRRQVVVIKRQNLFLAKDGFVAAEDTTPHLSIHSV